MSLAADTELHGVGRGRRFMDAGLHGERGRRSADAGLYGRGRRFVDVVSRAGGDRGSCLAAASRGNEEARRVSRAGLGLGFFCKTTGEAEGAGGWFFAKLPHPYRYPSDPDPVVQIGVFIVFTGGLVST
jgi:hypothetical protein